MPHKPEEFGRFPLIARRRDTQKPIRAELLLDYENLQLYFCNKKTGTVDTVAKDIFNKIVETRVTNSSVQTVDADKMDPPMIKETDIPLSINRRVNNRFYYIIKKRLEGMVDDGNP